MADADVWTDGIEDAVDQIEDGKTWTIPHLTVHRLTKIGTMRFKADQDFEPEDLEEPPYEGVAGGGMFVMQREAYEAARLTEGSVAGARRTSQPRWPGRHCTAYRGGELTRCGISGTRRWSATLRAIGSKESRALWERYRSANHNRPRMRELVGEGVESYESVRGSQDSVC